MGLRLLQNWRLAIVMHAQHSTAVSIVTGLPRCLGRRASREFYPRCGRQLGDEACFERAARPAFDLILCKVERGRPIRWHAFADFWVLGEKGGKRLLQQFLVARQQVSRLNPLHDGRDGFRGLE